MVRKIMNRKKFYPRRHTPKNYRYIEHNRHDQDKYIVIKQDSLYKPMLVVIFIFLIAMVILFPNSIFDVKFPVVMEFLRDMVDLMFLSAVATLFILPISLLDVRLVTGIFARPDLYDLWYVGFIILVAVAFDTFFALIGYKFSKTLRKLFASRTKAADVEKTNNKLNRYGNFGMFILSTTPLPFTLGIYTAGAIRLNKYGFLIAVSAGRLVKYTSFAVLARLFGIILL
jgi:membrane protein YqaA with SNARE-associated domain